MNNIEKLKNDPVNRRAFLQRMGAAGLGVAAVALLDGCGGGNGNSPLKTQNPNATPTNAPMMGNFPVALPGRNTNQQVLNFALTLEILEADLYRQALNIASGKALNDNNGKLRAPGDYTLAVGSGGINAAAGFAYLKDFAFVEAAHRDFLMMAVPDDVEVKPNPKGYTFGANSGIGPGSDLKALLTAIYPLEEEGVSAYLGAARFITDLPTLQTAVTIYSTEARHSAAIAYILGLSTGPEKSIPGVGPRQDVVLPGYGSIYKGLSQGKFFEYFIDPVQVATIDIQPFIVK